MKRIILAGGSGFLGRSLAGHFLEGRWEVVILTRSPTQGSAGCREVGWNTDTLGPWQKELDGAAAVINLAGKSVNCRVQRQEPTGGPWIARRLDPGIG